MKNQLLAGRYQDATWRPSPNYDARPPGSTVDLLVIHAISLPPGQFGGEYVDALFCNSLDYTAHPAFAILQGLTVSAHFVIDRKGRMTQYVATDQRAWHAGVASFSGHAACNDYSIGIELEGDDETPFETKQYERLATLSRTLMQAYPKITAARVVGHADIAPRRKTDPGPHFDWIRFRASIT